MRIGEMLVEEGRLSRRKLDEALAAQSRLGGRLGTTLLELGSIDEEPLLEALGRQRATRTVSKSDLENIPASVVRLIPARLAERYGMVPFRLKGRTLFVASRDVGDPLKEDEIGFLTSSMVRTCIALEFRIQTALERYYHLGGEARYQALAHRLAARVKGDGAPGNGSAPAAATPAAATPSPPTRPPARLRRPSTAPSPASGAIRPKRPPKPAGPVFIELDEEDAALLGSSTDAEPWAPTPDEPVILEPTPLPWLARESSAAAAMAPAAPPAADPPTASPPPEGPPAAAPAAAVAPAPAAPVEGSGAPPASRSNAAGAPESSGEVALEEWLRRATSELKGAEIRDDIADVLLAFSEPFLKRRVLLIARKDRIVGWRGEGEEITHDGIRAVEIPGDEPSIFLGLTGAGSFWLGALPVLPANQPLIEGLGGKVPKECLVLPVILRSRVICYLYGDNLGAGVAGAPVAELRRLAAKAGLAFEVYILKNKMRML